MSPTPQPDASTLRGLQPPLSQRLGSHHVACGAAPRLVSSRSSLRYHCLRRPAPSRDSGTPLRLSSASNWPFPVYTETGAPFPCTSADPGVDWLDPTSPLPPSEAEQIGPRGGKDWPTLEVRVVRLLLSRDLRCFLITWLRPGKRPLCLAMGFFLRVTCGL